LLAQALAELPEIEGGHRSELVSGAIVPLGFANNEVICDESNRGAIAGKTVLLLDGAVHSGRTMSRCAEWLSNQGANAILSYSLVVKQCSSFIPTMWGVMTSTTDRTYFLLKSIPNNRLTTCSKSDVKPLHIRKLDSCHALLPPLNSGLSSIDSETWEARLYEMRNTSGARCTYVLENKCSIVGLLTVTWENDNTRLAIEELAIDRSQQGQKLGGILMRFADTMARQSNCASVRLNAIENRVSWYEGYDYRQDSLRDALTIGAERYIPMERTVLYHQDFPVS
jgi:ribosomal protein S18 acetylase RimI-like enzyme